MRRHAQPAQTRGRSRGQGIVSRLSLRWRLTIATFGLLAILLTGLGLLITLTFQQTLMHDQAVTLREDVRLALARGGGILRSPPSSTDSSGSVTNVTIITRSDTPPPATAGMSPQLTGVLPQLVNRLTGGPLAASVWTPNGDPVPGTVPDTQRFVATIQPDDGSIQSALSQPLAADSYTLAIGANGQRQLVVLFPIVENGHTVGLLELNTPTTQIDRSVASIRLMLFLGIAGCLAVAALVARPLIDAALRPLVSMERASRRIADAADGALSLRLEEPPTTDEIGRLAHSFNGMVARLDAAFTRQKRFVADVSHELRTPLTALAGGIEMLLLGADQQDPADPEAGRRLLRGLYAETERMRRLVEDLLTLTRLDEGRMQMRLEPLDAGTLVGEICEQARHLARGQEIRCEIESALPSVRADGDRLRQVLLNLVENAVKYTPPSGRITLSAKQATGSDGRTGVRIGVRDSGAGIPTEALPHVFDRFYRVDEARSRPQPNSASLGGSGLGLAIAKSLVEAQGGAIAISSAMGEGTELSLWLPPSPEHARVPPDAHATGSRRRTIPPLRSLTGRQTPAGAPDLANEEVTGV